MALSQEVRDMIAFAQQMGYDKLNQFPPEQTREMMKDAPANANPTHVSEVTNMTTPETDIPVRIYIPEGDGAFPVTAYFHGGGFTVMSIDTHDEICRQLCSKSGSIVMSVEYSLAPENPYPKGPEDCVIATSWLIKHAADFNGIGDKAAVRRSMPWCRRDH